MIAVWCSPLQRDAPIASSSSLRVGWKIRSYTSGLSSLALGYGRERGGTEKTTGCLGATHDGRLGNKLMKSAAGRREAWVDKDGEEETKRGDCV